MIWSLGLSKPPPTLHHLGLIQLLVHHIGLVLNIVYHHFLFLLGLLVLDILPIPILWSTPA